MFYSNFQVEKLFVVSNLAFILSREASPIYALQVLFVRGNARKIYVHLSGVHRVNCGSATRHMQLNGCECAALIQSIVIIAVGTFCINKDAGMRGAHVSYNLFT